MTGIFTSCNGFLPLSSASLIQAPAPTPPSRVEEVETLILSDVHLGSDLSRADALLTTLKSYAFRRLILLGDVLDDLNFSRLPASHWAILAYLRTLCEPERNVEVVWVEGNHDRLLSKVTRNFLGLSVRKRYQWTSGGKTFLAMHGHQFDTFVERHPFITEAACQVYLTIQRLDSKQHRVSRFLKRTSKAWLRMSDLVAEGAAAYAARRGVDGILCGHTHRALSRVFDKVIYHNTGCWTEKPATFITLNEGRAELREYP